MTIDFYYLPGSAPCRAVQMTAKAVGVDLNLKLTNLMAGEHLTPEFIKINPQHTIPTLHDNGFSIWESRAIMIYLNDKYAKNDSLYPKDPQKRAVVLQRLLFDQGTLYEATSKKVRAGFMKQPITDEMTTNIDKALGFLNTFLENSTYAAGNTLTLADISLYATVSTLSFVKHDITSHPNVTRWLNHLKKTIPGEELNQAGLDWIEKFIKDREQKS